MIQTTTVAADQNLKYTTDLSVDTQDKIFLLNIAEAGKYFDANIDRQCVLTEYAFAHGASGNRNYTDDGSLNCWWWLRTPGSGTHSVSVVDPTGQINAPGEGVDNDCICVRPTLWINLDA